MQVCQGTLLHIVHNSLLFTVADTDFRVHISRAREHNRLDFKFIIASICIDDLSFHSKTAQFATR